MSVALAHFSVGFGSFVLIHTISNVYRNTHLITAAVASGIFAMIPDFHHVLPVYSEIYFELIHESVFATVFWGHYLLDIYDVSDSNYILFVCLIYLCVTICIRELYLKLNLNQMDEHTQVSTYE